MKSRSLEEMAADLAKLSPQTIQRSRDMLQASTRARISPQEHPSIDRSAASDATVRFEVKFAEDDVALKRVQADGWTMQQGKRRISLLPKLTQQDLESMGEQRALLVRWLGQKEQNAAMFLADPVAALQSAGARLDEDLIHRIKESRRRQVAFARAPTAVQVSSIRIRPTDTVRPKIDTGTSKSARGSKTRKDTPAIKPSNKGKHDEYQ